MLSQIFSLRHMQLKQQFGMRIQSLEMSLLGVFSMVPLRLVVVVLIQKLS